MRGPWRPLLVGLGDVALLLISALGLWRMRYPAAWPQDEQWMPFILISLAAPLCFSAAGAYRVLREMRLGQWLSRTFIGMLALISLLMLVGYLTKQGVTWPRLAFGPWLLLGTLLCILWRIVWHGRLIRRYRSGHDLQRCLIVARPQEAAGLVAHIERNPWCGLRVVGICSPIGYAAALAEDYRLRRMLVRGVERVAQMVRLLHVERVVICAHGSEDGLLRESLANLRTVPIRIDLVPDFQDMALFTLRVGDLAGWPSFDLSAHPMDETAQILKWLEDKLLAGLALLLFAPVMLLVALILRLGGDGPALFIQPRHGLNGRRFAMYKFRSMRPAACDEAVQRALEGDDPQTSGYRPAVRNDPRITPFGHFLRKTSLDELPQLFNVLKGDMSLVGPRPQPIALNEHFIDTVSGLMHRHYVKPGITGLAQISGARGNASTADRMQKRIDLDLTYIRRWNLWLDLKIIVLTAVKGFVNTEP